MLHRQAVLVVAIFALAVGGACRKPAKVILTKDQRIRIQENLLSEAPKPKYLLNANFSDMVRLVGVDLSAEPAIAGQELIVTYYWESLKEVTGAWKIFVHLELPGGKRMVLDHVPVGELYPMNQWVPGEIIRDIQKVVLDKDTKTGNALLWVGVFNEEIYQARGGGDRMTLVNKDQVANDGDNRVQAARFMVQGREKTARAAPKLVSMRAQGPVVVDGKLNDEAWSKAAVSAPLPSASGAGAADSTGVVTVRSLWDDQNVYFAFEVADDQVGSTYTKRDDELWNQDCVELYLDGKADGKDYLEIQVSPANVVFDALFSSRRTPEWQKAKEHDVPGLLNAVSVQGTINRHDDKDQGYTVEIAVPHSSIPGFAPVPPKPGSTLRVNFFRIDSRDGKVVGANAFGPAGGDFHDLEKAGTLVFAEPGSADAPSVQAVQAAITGRPSVGPAARSIQKGSLDTRAGKDLRRGIGVKPSLTP